MENYVENSKYGNYLHFIDIVLNRKTHSQKF